MGLQLFDGPPNPTYTCLPVRKLADFPHPRQFVPDFNQTATWPACGERSELLFVSEVPWALYNRSFFVRDERRGGIVGVDIEKARCFFHTPSIPLLRKGVKRNVGF